MTTQPASSNPLATPTLAIGIVAAVLSVLSVLPVVGSMATGFAFLASIAAVVLGHITLAKSFDKRARLGLIFGYIGLGVTVGWLIVIFIAITF